MGMKLAAAEPDLQSPFIVTVSKYSGLIALAETKVTST
jgi:hypothetical protein